jgi:ElaB/YqjD/DUF883 family membrane-anchored ribosome-binding protein
MAEFQAPASIEDAESRRVQITDDIQRIQAQLGEKLRTGKGGEPLNGWEYKEWRRKAQHVLNEKLSEMRVLKLWIRDTRQRARAARQGTDSAMGHLQTLYAILASFDHDDLDEDELCQIEAARDFLVRSGITVVETPAA